MENPALLPHYACFNRFEITMTLAQARSVSHPGDCNDDVAELMLEPSIADQFNSIDPEAIRAELAEYGAWDDAELADDAANQHRVVWLAGGNIIDEYRRANAEAP